MTSSHTAALEAREQRIAHLERRLQERENTVSDLADEVARLRVALSRARGDAEYPPVPDWLERHIYPY